MEKSKKRFIIFLVGFIIGVIGFTSSFLLYLKPVDTPQKEEKEDKQTIITGDIVFSTIDDSISIKDAIPTLDKFGVQQDGFSFSIKNIGNESKEYQLTLVDDNSTISNNYIRYELIKNNESLGINTLTNDGVLEKSVVNVNEEINYTIKLWLDYNSEVKNGRFSKKIAVDELSGEIIQSVINKPVLTDGMIPVYYDDNSNSWYKADLNNIDDKWYSYSDKKWANVVTVDREKRDYYLNSEIGTRIIPEDINSMWVWIPRFNYELDSNKITFVSKDKDAYQAFTFNNYELSGFWFAKFESGMKEDSVCISSSLTKKCNDSNNILYFVPNYPFATKITMANMFYAIRKMELKNNIYGFNGMGTKLNNDGTIKGDSNNIDIHMIKNSEWQAVAILTSSEYGNNMITNNNSSFTGKAYINEEEYSYNVIGKGDKASTTGNVYGIYDMAGGKRELVMINNDEVNIFNKKSNSGFTNSVKEYYYDNGFTDNDLTLLLKEKYSKDNLINKEPITRGGYKNIGNIFNVYGATDYIDKVSVETNSRASLVIIEGEE